MSIHLPIKAVNGKNGEGDSKEKLSEINRGKQRRKTALEFSEFIKNSLRKNEKTNLSQDFGKTIIRKKKKRNEEDAVALDMLNVSLNHANKTEKEQKSNAFAIRHSKLKAENGIKSSNSNFNRLESKEGKSFFVRDSSLPLSDSEDTAIPELMKALDAKNHYSLKDKYGIAKNLDVDAESIIKKQKWTKSFEDFAKELINEKNFRSSFIDFMTKFDAASYPILNTLKNLQTMHQIPQNSLTEILSSLSYKKINDTFFLNLQLYPEELGKIELFMRKEGNDILGTAIVMNEEAKAVFMKDMDMLSDYFQEKGYNFKGIDVEIGNNSANSNDDSLKEFLNASINNTTSFVNAGSKKTDDNDYFPMSIYRLGKYVNHKA